MLSSVKILLPVLFGCCAFLCRADEIHPHRDSIKKFRIKEIKKLELTTLNNGEQETITYNRNGDVIKEMFCLIAADTVTLRDEIRYTYVYDTLNRPVCRIQYGVRYNTTNHTTEKNPIVTDSMYTHWYYNISGWADSITTDDYSSRRYARDGIVHKHRHVRAFEYEPYKDFIIRTEYIVRWEYFNGAWKSSEIYRSNDLQLFKDNPSQVLRIVNGCDYRGEGSISYFHYVKKGNLTYQYKTRYGSGKCKLKSILKNDTNTINHEAEGAFYLSRIDPLGSAVPDTSATFNSLGLLLHECISPQSQTYWTLEYSYYQ